MESQKERPIIFSSEMVRAILDGRKTQTRRPIKPQPVIPFGTIKVKLHDLENGKYGFFDEDRDYICPYRPGDILWVRETCAISRVGDVDGAPLCEPIVIYKADGYPDGWESGYIQRSPIFMPKWASRIKLEVTDIRVERIQEISSEDIHKEGIDRWEDYQNGKHISVYQARGRFKALWDSLWAKKGFGWGQNPWVNAIEFRRIEGGMDKR